MVYTNCMSEMPEFPLLKSQIGQVEWNGGTSTTPQLFRQKKQRWQGVNWQQKLQGISTAHWSIIQKQIWAVFIMHYNWIQQSWLSDVWLAKEKNIKKPIIGCADSVVISCIRYWNGIGDETGLLLVLWLLIAESKAQNHPLQHHVDGKGLDNWCW